MRGKTEGAPQCGLTGEDVLFGTLEHLRKFLIPGYGITKHLPSGSVLGPLQ